MIATVLALSSVCLAAAPKNPRIDLATFARVVRYEGNSPETLQVRELQRGVDGWTAWKGEDGQYMIGVEWDEPRDLAEVNIEFRHAIADREQIRVQYWRHHWPDIGRGGWASLDDPFHGDWQTVKVADWWAGDRDVTFEFAPYKQEQPGDKAPDVRYRRTYRLRFLIGKEEPPPVRYIRAYSPAKHAETTFEVRIDEKSTIQAPVELSVVNGHLLEQPGGEPVESMEARNAPLRFLVRYAQGDVETQTRTIVTVRDGRAPLRGLSFLPMEAIERGVIRVPALGVTIAHVDSEKDLQVGMRPGMSIMDRVTTEPEQTWERARREIPALKKTTQRPVPLYLPLGPPGARQEIGVSYDGSFFLHATALKVPAADSARLQWPGDGHWRLRLKGGPADFDQSAEGAVKQSLHDGYLPVVVNSWEAGGVSYEQTCVATFLNGDPKELKGDEPIVLLMRLRMKNAGTARATARVELSPDPAETLTISPAGQVLATARAKEGKAYEQARHRFHVRSQDSTAFALAATPGEATSVEMRRELAPGEACEVRLALPYITLSEKEQEQLAKLDFDAVLNHEADRWRAIVSRQATIEVPSALLSDFYRSNLTHILINADRDPFNGTWALPAATYGYNVCLNESCHQIRSLEMRGLHDEARRYLDAIVAGQSSMPLHGRYTDQKGVFHGLPSAKGNYQSFRYNLDHGFALWMLGEHYRFTRDKEWLRKNADALIAACDSVVRQRKRPEESDTLGVSDQRWGEGLLPPGHLEDPPEWLWWFAVNAYAARGMNAAADALTEVGHPEAARIRRAAQAYTDHLRESCRESMVRAPVVRLRDGTYVPHQPTRSRLRGRDLGWIRDVLYGPIHLMDCGVYEDESPEAEWILRDTEDNVFIGEDRGRKLTDFDSQWFSWGGITLQSNLLPNPLVYIRRNQPKHAIRAFYNSLAANVYEDVRTFTEHPIQSYGIGQGPFFKTPDESAFIVWLRSLLICENGDTLEVLPAVPMEWLAEGKKITVKGAATWFGPMDLAVSCTGDQMDITLQAPTRNPPRALRLHVRRPDSVKTIVLNGTPVAEASMTSGAVIMEAKR